MMESDWYLVEIELQLNSNPKLQSGGRSTCEAGMTKPNLARFGNALVYSMSIKILPHDNNNI